MLDFVLQYFEVMFSNFGDIVYMESINRVISFDGDAFLDHAVLIVFQIAFGLFSASLMYSALFFSV